MIHRHHSSHAGMPPIAGRDLEASVSPNASGAAASLALPIVVHSISNVGVSLRMGAHDHAVLEAFDELLLSLKLPGKQQPSVVSCHVRHRALDADGALYVCEYDWSATMDPLGVVEDVVGYMLEVEDES